MMRTEAKALRDLAAEHTQARIAADRRRASPAVLPLIDYIAAHLFEHDLSYERIRRELDIRDNNRSTVCRQDIGLTPAAYIRELRFDVACRLLRDTDLDIARIGDLAGYRGPNVFGAAFRRWAGLSPARYRRQERRAEASGVTLPAERPDFSPAAWRRFVEGELPDRDADLLLRYLLDRYPKSRGRLVRELLRAARIDQADADTHDEKTAIAPSLRSLFARDDIEQLMAELVWEDVHEKPWAELHDLVRHHLRFTTPAFVHLLGERSREEGREDRARGIGIARLAIAAAEVLEGDGADTGGQGPLKALAWAWLGNAKRLALDFFGADAAFRAAQQRLPAGADRETGMVLSMLAALRSWQRRYDEAVATAEEAISHLQQCGETKALAQSLLVRATAERQLGLLEQAARDNEAAAQLLEPLQDRERHLYFLARLNHAICLVDAGDGAAAGAMVAVRELAEPSQPIYSRVLWLEGLFAAAHERKDEARRKLQAAKARFEAREEKAAAAVIGLDLALVSIQAGDRGSARELLRDILPLLDALMLDSESQAAQVLRDEAREVKERLTAILTEGLTARALQNLRKAAGRLGEI